MKLLERTDKIQRLIMLLLQPEGELKRNTYYETESPISKALSRSSDLVFRAAGSPELMAPPTDAALFMKLHWRT